MGVTKTLLAYALNVFRPRLCLSFAMPPEARTAETFRTALSKGQGRALQAVLAKGRLIDEEAMLDACLHDRSFDPQLEAERAPWLFDILAATESVDRLQPPILEALSQSSDTWDLAQLCDLAEIYARRGSEKARAALYRTWDRIPDPSAPWLAEEPILRLDGLEGLLYIAERRGSALRRGDENLGVQGILEAAEGICGPRAVADALEAAALRSADTTAFVEQAQEERRQNLEKASEDRVSLGDRIQAITPVQVLDAIEGGSLEPTRSMLGRWGRHADEDSLQRIAEGMLREEDPARLVRYLAVFSRRPLPDFDARLIGLLDHADAGVRRRAAKALAETKAQAVRDLALHRLEDGKADGDTLGLLKRNYRDGDHRLIESRLVECDDPDKTHDLCWGLRDVFDQNNRSEGAGCMLFGYEQTPCSNCRQAFFAWLLDRGKAPAEVTEECRFDANPDIRDLAESARKI